MFLWHLIAIICFLSINTSSSTYLKLNNNNHRIIDDSNANNDSSNDDDGSNNKEDNFVSGTEVERRMFSGLVYNKPTTTKTENADSNNNLRFQSLSVQQTSKERLAAIEKMKVGICACKFEDTISATKVTGEAGAGVQWGALCGQGLRDAGLHRHLRRSGQGAAALARLSAGRGRHASVREQRVRGHGGALSRCGVEPIPTAERAAARLA